MEGSLSLRGLLGWQGLTLLPVVLPPTHLLSSLHPSCPLSFLPPIVLPLSCRLFFLPSAGCTLSCQLNCTPSFPPAVLPPFCLQSSLPLLDCPPPTGLSPKPPAVGCSALQRRPGNRALGRHLGPCLPVDGSALVWCSLGLLQPHCESGLAAGQGSVCSQCLWPLLYPGCAPELPGCQTGVSQSQTWTSSGCCKGEGGPGVTASLSVWDGPMGRWKNGQTHMLTAVSWSPAVRGRACVQVQVCGSQGFWGALAPTYLRSPSLEAGVCFLLPPPPCSSFSGSTGCAAINSPPSPLCPPSRSLGVASAVPCIPERSWVLPEGRLDLAGQRVGGLILPLRKEGHLGRGLASPPRLLCSPAPAPGG